MVSCHGGAGGAEQPWVVISRCCTGLCSKPKEKPKDEIFWHKDEMLWHRAQRGAEPVGTGSLAPASALAAVAKN